MRFKHRLTKLEETNPPLQDVTSAIYQIYDPPGADRNGPQLSGMSFEVGGTYISIDRRDDEGEAQMLERAIAQRNAAMAQAL